MPTVGEIGHNENYIFYDLEFNNKKNRSYIIGMLHVDFNNTNSPIKPPRDFLPAPDLSQHKYDFWSLCPNLII